ncbi:hypothetical protein ACFVS2_26190 [Brevibacillus sp. NPDC058079]|uniref:hypothetical protein n=1 Tax=Brevibacillus sp. NPDC058079 TaxID=3346330 RepID=UPI0036EAB1DE
MLVNVVGMDGVSVANIMIGLLGDHLIGGSIELDERDGRGGKRTFVINQIEVDTKTIHVSPLTVYKAYPTRNTVV